MPPYFASSRAHYRHLLLAFIRHFMRHARRLLRRRRTRMPIHLPTMRHAPYA